MIRYHGGRPYRYRPLLPGERSGFAVWVPFSVPDGGRMSAHMVPPYSIWSASARQNARLSGFSLWTSNAGPRAGPASTWWRG